MITRTACYRFIGVWQQESGKGPQIANGAVNCVPDLTMYDINGDLRDMDY